jgi:uncharacterized iron-regulated membrane protein
MTLLTRFVILAHRYLGIAIGLLVVMWFASGIVMMYAGGMPRLTPQARLDRLPEIDLSRVRLTPAEAAERAHAGAPAGAGRLKLLTVIDRPAYRAGAVTIFADTGEMLDGLSAAQARTTAAAFLDLPEHQIHLVETLASVDQWTLSHSRSLPLHRFRAEDEDGTELYLQPSSGEIVTVTTRRSRWLAWVGTIPHWLYFSALRQHQPLWYRLVVWTSAAACVLSLLGLVLSVTQFRRVRPFRLANAIPYSGWMRWHYVTGAVFGLFTLTWAFSGLLSMEPFAWTNARGVEVPADALAGGPPDLSRFPAVNEAAWRRVLDGRRIKEVEFVRIQDEHYYVVRQTPRDANEARRAERLHQPYYVTGRAEQDRLLVNAATFEVRQEPFSTDSLIGRLKAAVPDVPVLASELLTDYDSYYYSRGRQTPLPVLRVKFADPAETWVYVDPEMGRVLAEIPRLARVERWLYNGLHSLDFAFWYHKRPLWDIGMLILLLGGLTSSGVGLALGVKRLRRGSARAARRTASLLGPRPAHERVDGIDGGSGGHEERTTRRTAERQVRGAFRQQDAPDQVSGRREDLDAVPGARPDVAELVGPDAVGDAPVDRREYAPLER